MGYPRRTHELSAVEEIILAARDIDRGKAADDRPREFTEWELSVAAWRRNPTRFGMRGYSDLHPDHKRVSMEMVGQNPSNPVYHGLLNRIRPSVYRLTPRGRAFALSVEDRNAGPNHYDQILRMVEHCAFTNWLRIQSVPGKGAADAFRAISGNNPTGIVRRVIERCIQNEADGIFPSQRNGVAWYKTTHIALQDVFDLGSFLEVLKNMR